MWLLRKIRGFYIVKVLYIIRIIFNYISVVYFLVVVV